MSLMSQEGISQDGISLKRVWMSLNKSEWAQMSLNELKSAQIGLNECKWA